MKHNASDLTTGEERIVNAQKPVMPTIDIAVAAKEIKKHLAAEKMNLVDHSFTNIELWFSEEDLGNFPEVARFTTHWKAMFDYADTCTDDIGVGFPNDDFVRLEAKLKEIENVVNADAKYWKALREEII